MLYKAFISYSHAADSRLAPALQSGLERFAKPWYRMRNFRIFRDQTNLAVAPELWPRIAEALDASEYLVLMASPKSATSPWVERELEHWRNSHSSQNILIVLTGGTIAWDDRRGDFCWEATTA